MAKFHINAAGNATACRATKGKCPFGGEEKHYSTREEARDAYEKEQSFEMLSKMTSSGHKAALEFEYKEAMEAREKASALLGASFVKVPGRIGYTYQKAVDDVEYDRRVKEYERLTAEADEKSKALRAFKPTPRWESSFTAAKNLEASQMKVLELRDSKNTPTHVQETLDRYHAGERITTKNPLPSDELLHELAPPDSIPAAIPYTTLVFPDKELKPVLDRLGVGEVSVAPLLNMREAGLVYTVNDPEGNTRSFSLYEHRNTDSLIINGKTNWDREAPDQEHGPYAGDSKNAFFAEFGPEDHRQAAETLGYFLKAAKTGELESDEELVAKVGRRDWNAILSETIPGFREWLEKQKDS